MNRGLMSAARHVHWSNAHCGEARPWSSIAVASFISMVHTRCGQKYLNPLHICSLDSLVSDHQPAVHVRMCLHQPVCHLPCTYDGTHWACQLRICRWSLCTAQLSGPCAWPPAKTAMRAINDGHQYAQFPLPLHIPHDQNSLQSLNSVLSCE